MHTNRSNLSFYKICSYRRKGQYNIMYVIQRENDVIVAWRYRFAHNDGFLH